MHKWVEAKVQYDKDVEGVYKTVTDTYMVDAFTLMEANETIYKELGDLLKDFAIVSLKFLRVAEVWMDSDDMRDYWYKFKVQYEMVDDKTGQSKEKKWLMLVNANDIDEAMLELKGNLKSYLVPWQIKEVSETKILDIFKYSGALKEDDPRRQLEIDFKAKSETDPEPADSFGPGDLVHIVDGAHYGNHGSIVRITEDGSKAHLRVNGAEVEAYLDDLRHYAKFSEAV